MQYRVILSFGVFSKQQGMVERLGEMRKGRRERIEKGSREGIEKETKRQFGEGRPERPPLY